MTTNVNLKLLHTFLLVADHNSFRRAAEESNRSQSAVSMQIRQLELQLGVSLFHRTTRRVQLTREGELLLGSARKAVLELQAGLRQIREAAGAEQGRLSFACAPSVAISRLPSVLAAFQAAHPEVSAHVHELASADMLEAIRRQDVDFGIGPRVAGAGEFDFTPIVFDEICALVPYSLPQADGESISLTDLSALPILLVTGTSALHGALDEAQQTAGVTLNIKYEVHQVQTQIAMASAGLGVAILPRIAIPAEPDPRLKIMAIVGPTLSRELCVISLRGQALPPAAMRFIPMLQTLMGEGEAEDAGLLPEAATAPTRLEVVRTAKPRSTRAAGRTELAVAGAGG